MIEERKNPKLKRLRKKVVADEEPKVIEETQTPAAQVETEQGTKKRKGGRVKQMARKRVRPQPDEGSDDEHKKCLRVGVFDDAQDFEIMESRSVITSWNKVTSPEGDYLAIYRANGMFRAFTYLMEVLHIFDRQDLFNLYDLIMKQHSKTSLDGLELILWGDLSIMMESST